MNLTFRRNGYTYSVIGTVITIFNSDGVKLRHLFFHSHSEARNFFLAIA